MANNKDDDNEKKTNIADSASAIEKYLVELAGGYIENFTHLYLDTMYQSVEMFTSSVQYENDMFNAYMDRATVLLENSLNTMVEGVSKTANDIASQAVRQRMAEANANVKARVKEITSAKEFEIKRAQALKTLSEDVVNTSTAFAKANLEFLSSDGVKNLSSDVIKGIGGIFGIDLSILGDATKALLAAPAILEAGVENFAELFKGAMTYDIQIMQAEKELYETAGQQLESILSQGEKAVGKILELSDNVRKIAEDNDKLAHTQAVQVGFYGKQGDIYAKAMMNTASRVAEKFGKTSEELINMQKAYIEESTRNVQMSAVDFENMVATGRTFGMDDSQTAQMFGSMNVFNTSVESGTDMLNGMYKTVTKMGLSASKFAKDLNNNLKLAQKYNFKGGLENMMKMTQWAEQTRVNMTAATSFAEKFLSGSISEALETSARLQVLGGSASMYSDPIAMLYEAGADMGSFMKRQAAMFGDIVGKFDEKTGETVFSWYENMMIRQRAAAAGMSEEDAKNMIRQRHKQGVIDKVLRGSGLSDEEKTAIGNRATYDQKSGKWVVTDINGNKHNVDELKYNKAVLENLMPENKDDAMISIAQKSLGFAEQQTVLQKAIAYKLGADMYGAIEATSKQNTATEREHYDKNWDFYKNNVNISLQKSVEALQHQYEDIENGKDAITRIVSAYLDVVDKINRTRPADAVDLANRMEDLGEYGNVEEMINHFVESIKQATSQENYDRQVLLNEAFKNFNQYSNDMSKVVYPSLIKEGKELASVFPEVGRTITHYFGKDAVIGLGMEGLYKGTDMKYYFKETIDATKAIGGNAWDHTKGWGIKKFEDGKRGLQNFWNRLTGQPLIEAPAPYVPPAMNGVDWWWNNNGTTPASTESAGFVAPASMPNGWSVRRNDEKAYSNFNNSQPYTSATASTESDGFVAPASMPNGWSVMTNNGKTSSYFNNNQPYTSATASYESYASVVTPISTIDSNVGRIRGAVMKIVDIIGKPNNNTVGNVNLNNNINVSGNSESDLKELILSALRDDPSFNRAISELVSRGNVSSYNLSGNVPR